nr:MAG TPA_asm: hypothetical protein [Caudoviricetes sp.]
MFEFQNYLSYPISKNSIKLRIEHFIIDSNVDYRVLFAFKPVDFDQFKMLKGGSNNKRAH